MEAYRRYTPFDPTSETQQATVAMAFIGQSALDIKRKLQRLEGLHAMTLQDLETQRKCLTGDRGRKERRKSTKKKKGKIEIQGKRET